MQNSSDRRAKNMWRRREPYDSDRWVYHRRWAFCIIAGEIDEGGLVMVIPVEGLMIGMTLRVRFAGCW
jgi:hypothetical protein